MFESHNQGGEPGKTIPAYLKIAAGFLVVVVLYLGYIFVPRWQQNHAFEQRQAQQQTQDRAKQATADQKAVEAMGGNRFDILKFYADPTAIARGDSTSLCYSVSNATSVTLEPQSNAVWPAFSKCVTVSPRKTTEYTLTATDANGQTKQSKISVEVH